MANPLHSREAEQAVLGGLFVSPVAFADVAGVVREADFFEASHRVIFATLTELVRQGREIDLVVVLDALEGQGRLDAAGGMAYLASLARDTPSAANVLAYAAIVRNHAQRRALVNLGVKIGQWTMADADADVTLNRLRRALEALDGVSSTDGPRLLADLLPGVLERLDERANRSPGTRLGAPIGLAAVDDLLDGLCPGRLYVAAGRPGTGKSVFGLQALRAVVTSGCDALLFTLEMPAEEAIHRLLAAEQPLNYSRLQAARLGDGDWAGLAETVYRMRSARLWIDDSSQLAITDLLARARRRHRQHPLGLVVVDYLGLVKGDGDNRVLEIGSITRALKGLAKELNAPVLLLAQLNRSLEQRADKRPILSDLRESGSVEQDADVVLFLYRDELHNPESPDKGCAELLVRKNRAGKTGVVPLAFQGEFCRFMPLAGGLPSWNKPADEPFRPKKRGIDL